MTMLTKRELENIKANAKFLRDDYTPTSLGSQWVETIENLCDTYAELLDEYMFLCALKAAGVDNWSGYSIAFDILEEAENG